MTMRGIWVALVAVVALVVEGTFFAQAPYSLAAALYLPAIYVKRRSRRIGWLLALVVFESLFSRLPILAGIALIVVIEAAIELLEDDFNLRSLSVAAAVLPAIDLAKHFWTAIFAALYGLPAPLPLQPWLLLYAAAIGVVLHLVMAQMLPSDANAPKAGWA